MAGQMFGFTGAGVSPGIGSTVETVEDEICWGERTQRRLQSFQIAGAARDAGNSPTTVLRPGLLMGMVTATKQLKQYDPTATDGTEVVLGVIMQAWRVTDFGGSDQDLFVSILVGGPVKASHLINLDILARAQMSNHFIFDDAVGSYAPYKWQQVYAKTADYTVVAADNGKLFTTKGAGGAVNFTLPAPSASLKGFNVGFMSEADQNMTITSGTADTLVCFNDLAADSVAVSTAGGKIGAMFEVVLNSDGTKWLVIPHLSGHTLTVAT